jgi:hypothetical protein
VGTHGPLGADGTLCGRQDTIGIDGLLEPRLEAGAGFLGALYRIFPSPPVEGSDLPAKRALFG